MRAQRVNLVFGPYLCLFVTRPLRTRRRLPLHHRLLSASHAPSAIPLCTLNGEATPSHQQDSGLPSRFWAEAMSTFMYLRNRTPTTTNEGKMPYELFYDMVPDVGHIRTFGCVVRVVLPAELLGKLDERAAMGHLLRYKYDGAYRVSPIHCNSRPCAAHCRAIPASLSPNTAL